MGQNNVWARFNSSVIGHAIDDLALMPLIFDEQDVRKGMSKDSLSFSGAVHLKVGMHSYFFTWHKREPYALDILNQPGWRQDMLKAISVSSYPSWSKFLGQEISSTQTFSHKSAASVPVAVRINIRKFGVETALWVGTGGNDGLFEAEELWMSCGVKPRNIRDIIAY